MRNDQGYWFPAKRYGWGWGLPCAWQGWVVFVVFFGLVITGLYIVPPNREPGHFIAYVLFLNLLLLAVCWMKGEPPRWRWGKERGREK
jgi:hypothetical protein